jgi:hypothetical protein
VRVADIVEHYASAIARQYVDVIAFIQGECQQITPNRPLRHAQRIGKIWDYVPFSTAQYADQFRSAARGGHGFASLFSGISKG